MKWYLSSISLRLQHLNNLLSLAMPLWRPLSKYNLCVGILNIVMYLWRRAKAWIFCICYSENSGTAIASKTALKRDRSNIEEHTNNISLFSFLFFLIDMHWYATCRNINTWFGLNFSIFLNCQVKNPDKINIRYVYHKQTSKSLSDWKSPARIYRFHWPPFWIPIRSSLNY